jgi:hypothetical protein
LAAPYGSPVLIVLSCQPYLAVLSVLFCPSCPACLLLLSSSDCPVLPVLFCLSYSVSPVLPVLFFISCSECPALTVLSFLSCPGCLILAAMRWPCCPGSPVQEVLSWQSCPDSPVLAVLFSLPFSALTLVPVLCLSSSACPIPPVQFCLSGPILSVLSFWSCSRCLVQGFRSRQPSFHSPWSWQSCPGSPLSQSFQSCSACPVMPVPFCCPVLTVLF